MRKTIFCAFGILQAGQVAFGRHAAQAQTTVNVPAVEGFMTTSDSVRLFYKTVGTGRDVVVYIHGGPGSNFRGQDIYVQPLGRERTVIFYDQRGSGLSDLVADPKRLTVEDFVRDLEAVRRFFKVERMSIVALSWGAALAAFYTVAHPERVERLVLVSPMSPTFGLHQKREHALIGSLSQAAISRRRELRGRIATAPDTEVPGICRELIEITFRYLYVAAPTPAKLRDAARRCDIPVPAIRNRYVVEQALLDTAGKLSNWDFRPILTDLRKPVLVLEGTETKVPLGATRIWAATIPDARLLLVPRAGHELFLDQPVAFLRATRDFLAGRFPSGSRHIKDH